MSIDMKRNSDDVWPDDAPPGTFDVQPMRVHGHDLTRVEFVCPNSRHCAVVAHCGAPFSLPEPSKLKVWQWDGNSEAPTLSPSVNCLAPSGCGWHGHIVSGKLVP